MPNCTTCPSFLEADMTVSKFRKSVGAPMCGKYGRILGRPGASPEQSENLLTHIATGCDSYGEALPPVPLAASAGGYKFEVTFPDPDVLAASVDSSLLTACTTCASCKNFVRDDVVAREMGWLVGLCSAKGRLILPTRQTTEARECPYRQFGTVRSTTTGMHLLPEYEDAFGAPDVASAFFVARGSFVEPADYPSDKEVTDEDRATGIRAWRRIDDPAGSGNFTFLPCYDPAFFEEDERGLIPRTGDYEHPEMYADHFGGVYLCAVTWSELDETPALWGDAGTGKTELFRHLAWLMCLPFRRISITKSTEIDDLAGKMLFEEGVGTIFQYGRLPRAWTKPGVICLDEPNVGQHEVWEFIRPLTDNSKQLVLDMNRGEAVKRHNDCYFGMAMNPAWDPKNVGAEPIGDADANRLFHVFIEIPPPDVEKRIIMERVKLDGWELSEQQIRMVMSIAQDLRGLIEEGTLSISWAIRPQIKVSRALRWFDPITAYRRAVADYLEPEAQAAILDVVRTHAA
jgi:MoxR-like ATPase